MRHSVLPPVIASLLGVVSQKLVEVIAIGSGDLDRVKSCHFDHALGRCAEAGDRLCDLLISHGYGYREGVLAIVEEQLPALS